MFDHLIEQYFIPGRRERIIKRIGAETIKECEEGYYCKLCRHTPHRVFVRDRQRALRHLERVHGVHLNMTLLQFGLEEVQDA